MLVRLFAAAMIIAVPQLALAQAHPQSHPQSLPAPPTKVHRVVIQIDENDEAKMNLAMNNAQNMQDYYVHKGEKVEIEFVAFGPGLTMMRADKSPETVRERLAKLSHQGIVFSGCGNTKANQSKAENTPITLLADTREVPTGVARIVELQEQGAAYLRP